jgi:hypothetical protein
VTCEFRIENLELGESAMTRSTIRAFTCLLTLPVILLLFGFADTEPRQQKVLIAEMPLYLEEHLDAAHIEGSKVPEDVLEPVEWRFDEPQPDWKPATPWNPTVEPAQATRTSDALRVTLTDRTRDPVGRRHLHGGGLYIDVPDWNHEDNTYVLVRARTSEGVEGIMLAFNLREGSGKATDRRFPFRFPSDSIEVIEDGSVQTYRLRADWSEQWEGPCEQLGLWFASVEPASIDILSVSLIRQEAYYADAPVGIRDEIRNRERRRTVFTHTPGRLEYRLYTPEAARLDVGLGVLKEAPVAFRITAKPDGGDAVTVLDETYADEEHWAQRRVDLSDFSGKMITLSLEADAKRAGTVAFWAEPTVSGKRGMERPLPGTLIWDTQSPFVDEVDLRDRAIWQIVVGPTLRSFPDSYGRGYFFKGDAVVENEHLIAVFQSGKGRVVIYSKANSSRNKVEFAPLEFNEGPASITRCRILQNTSDEAALEVSFAGAETEERLSAIFSFSKKEVMEIKPAENMKGISLLSPIEYGIAPDFIADDLIFDPKEYPSASTLRIPSSNLFLGLLRGRNNMLVVTWPQGEQQMRLVLGDKKEKPRLIESVDIENDGKSIYLALLDAPGIWHKEELRSFYLEKDITINWKRPFPAKWITQLREVGVRTAYRFRGFRGKIHRPEIGMYIYPVWFEGENTFYRLGKRIPPKGESLIYFLERKGTPVSVSAPVDIMKETLGSQACDTILDVPGRVLRTHHRRPGVTITDTCCCNFTEYVLEPIFEEGQEVEKRELVEETVDDMVFFVTRIRERINEYQEFAHDMMEFLKLKRKSNPDLKPFLDSMETITQEIIQEYSRQRENMKTLDYVDELARKTKALAQKKDPNNRPTMLDLGEKWRGIGGAQDSLLGRLHSVTRQLFQEAGYGCVNQLEAMEIAKEIRSRCRECLRNPDGFEIWPDY